ncbi:Glutathione S-transferase epsilon, partial [Operophtera brumata]
MSRLILHRAIASPPARAVMMLGDILDLKFEIKDVNIIKKEHKSLEFMKYGGEHRERLYPSELRTRAIVDQCMFFNAGLFFQRLRTVGRLYPSELRTRAIVDQCIFFNAGLFFQRLRAVGSLHLACKV